MGRHLWRLLKPTFLWKMMRTRAVSLYGWDIIFRGTFWPGTLIGERCADIIKATAAAGHECGLHTWDHHEWQAYIEDIGPFEIQESLSKGVEALTKILGTAPTCSAVPGWKCNDTVLLEKEEFSFRYNSDCRGGKIFYPVVEGRTLSVPQIPVSLPTYDELLGRDGITNENYNDRLLAMFDPKKLNVLTIHAEAEGNACSEMFDKFLLDAREKEGIKFVPLCELLTGIEIGTDLIERREIPGREGWVSCVAKGA